MVWNVQKTQNCDNKNPVGLGHFFSFSENAISTDVPYSRGRNFFNRNPIQAIFHSFVDSYQAS